MSGESHIPYTLAALCAVGGVIGFYKGRSVMSLVGGGGTAALYAVSGYMISRGEAEKGHLAGLGASLMLAGIMSKRYRKTGAFVPAGALALVGATGTIYHGYKYNEWRKW